ncbi:hypothetical protein [Micromonospora foliorum]|uniref:hypothetical protein n=1 Tax=Micromonospora foliorum TaxID=2911210 RepID=UPI003F882EA1
MVLVAAGQLVGVEPGGWDELGVAVAAESDAPVAAVDVSVVMPAEQHGVVEAGGAAVDPVVVGVAPARWTVAAGERAALVAQHQGAA